MRRFSTRFFIGKSEAFALACAIICGLAFCVTRAGARAESDRMAACRSADLDARIAGCSKIIARGDKETKHNRVTAFVNRGAAYRGRGELDRALADLDKAVRLDPKAGSALTERASIKYSKREFDGAIADYNAAIVAEPKSATALYGRGEAHRAKNDLDRAIADYTESIEINPQSADALTARADAYRAKGDLEHAKQDLQAALKLDPRFEAARRALDEIEELIAETAAPSTAPAPPSTETPAPETPAETPATRGRERAAPLASAILFHVGPVPISRPVVSTWAIMLFLTITSWLLTRGARKPMDRRQALIELVVTGVMSQIEDIIRKDSRPLLPLIGTLFIFLVTANISGLLPGGEAPTSKLETPAALAFIVFFAVHFFGIKARGFFGYLASFAEPKLIMLPLNIVSEVTRTFSLMVRLFGNVMSGEFVIALVVALAGLFVPIPLMVLEVLVGVVQAYIFTVLATVFIGAAIGSVEKG